MRRSGDFNITTEKEPAVTVLGLASLLQGLWVRVPLECLVWPLSTSMFSLSPGLYLPEKVRSSRGNDLFLDPGKNACKYGAQMATSSGTPIITPVTVFREHCSPSPVVTRKMGSLGLPRV